MAATSDPRIQCRLGLIGGTLAVTTMLLMFVFGDQIRAATLGIVPSIGFLAALCLLLGCIDLVKRGRRAVRRLGARLPPVRIIER